MAEKIMNRKARHSVKIEAADFQIPEGLFDCGGTFGERVENGLIAAISHAYTNYFRRVTAKSTYAVKVIVLTDYDEAVFSCEIPYGIVIGALQSDQADMRGAWKRLLKKRHQPARQVLIQKQLHSAAWTEALWRSRSAA